MPARIDLDELLHGNPEWSQVVQWFKDGDCDGEEWLIRVIKRHLATVDQLVLMATHKKDIADLLNGRTNKDFEAIKQSIFDAWNDKLGFKAFGD
jgi:hypothetical protein